MPKLDSFRNALHAVGDKSALRDLRENAVLVRNALSTQEIALDSEEIANLNAHPEWLAEIYAALGTETNDEGADAQGYRWLEVSLADEQLEIAEAWSSLLDKLDGAKAPAGLGRWEQALQGIVETDQAFVRHLQAQDSVRKGGPAAQRLLRYGLTPFMLFDSLRSMELLFNRMLRSWRAPAEAQARPTAGLIHLVDKDVKTTLDRRVLIEQIGGAFDVQERQKLPLVESIFHMLEQSPLLVNGYLFEGANTFRKQDRGSKCTGFLGSGQLIARWTASASDAADLRFH